ncbi:MAG: hypothetical protein Q9183_003052, partial [Haloplaca sp. 2 TL-2023]
LLRNCWYQHATRTFVRGSSETEVFLEDLVLDSSTAATFVSEKKRDAQDLEEFIRSISQPLPQARKRSLSNLPATTPLPTSSFLAQHRLQVRQKIYVSAQSPHWNLYWVGGKENIRLRGTLSRAHPSSSPYSVKALLYPPSTLLMGMNHDELVEHCLTFFKEDEESSVENVEEFVKANTSLKAKSLLEEDEESSVENVEEFVKANTSLKAKSLENEVLRICHEYKPHKDRTAFCWNVTSAAES